MDLEPTTRYVPTLKAHRIERSIALKTIPVFVVGPSDLSDYTVAARAQIGVDFVATRFSDILNYLAIELLEIKNTGWLKTTESPLTDNQFRRNLTPRRITVLEDGAVEVGFDDSGMFWGHEVVIRTDASLRPVLADIEG